MDNDLQIAAKLTMHNGDTITAWIEQPCDWPNGAVVYGPGTWQCGGLRGKLSKEAWLLVDPQHIKDIKWVPGIP